MAQYAGSAYGSPYSSRSYVDESSHLPGLGLSDPRSSRKHREQISYFVPGYGISRHVMMSRIRYFVGHECNIRPFTYQQREGYLLTHEAPALTRVSLGDSSPIVLDKALTGTQNQIEDLKDLSRQFEEREAERMSVRSATLSSEELFINRPIPVQQRHSYVSDSEDRPRHRGSGRSR